MVGVSGVDDVEKVRDTVQIDNNMGGRRSPLTMNFRTAQKINPMRSATNNAGVVISISGGRISSPSQDNTSLSNIDMDLFATD